MKKNLNISKTLLKLTLILVCGISYGQTQITGKVISGISGETPISDIYVQELITKQPLIMADSLGNFRIEYLEPNKKYIVEISVFGYGKQKFDVQTKREINNVTFELKADCEYNVERAEAEWKNGKANLLLVGSIAPIANTSYDNRFEKKFGIKYFDFGCEPPIEECLKEYNERIFELMDKKYGMKWREKVRSDVEYLN
ncbi:carboxypeptidase-like regulatory domain-containing protein [Paucihalobacter ruber]|uniref:Carboxypeptidase-like regulatory domain-containing protein n=1 Tax=Paucihalobacter ruber TaxID=2567861 RepID=A0A506PB25_9FLAO|nr:carboxypeptidase-like regulatory domain-containing protein [Paucihalobacter ruber]TPV31171.1 carboxypeptidase-like regulatory domain-containing protein [Paucihalobacter ruber]